jgi:hypothetical protein
VAFTPDIYAAGISYVGPSNIITLLKSIPPYWAPMKKIFAIRVGDMDDPKEHKILEDQSPLNSAKNIKASLLVIQGANDPRVNKGESDRIVVALRDLHRPVEYLVAPYEGHGFAGKLNRLAAYTAMERFFAKHLGGRLQETITPEIQARLVKLTVDVNTIAVAENSSAQAPKSALSFDASVMKTDSMTYAGKMSMMGRDMTYTIKRTITVVDVPGGKRWRVVEITSSSMGSGTDTLDFDGASMMPLRRAGKQGVASLELMFTQDSITGKFLRGTTAMPVNVKLTEPTFPDGAGLEVPLTTLPMKEGYTSTIGVFDLMGGVKSMTLTVNAVEHLTVGTTAYDAYRVDLTNPDEPTSGQKFWITKDTRRLVRSEAKLPAAMGGGVVTSELQ